MGRATAFVVSRWWRRARNVLAGLVLAHVVLAVGIWSTRASWLPYSIAHAPNAGKTVEMLERAAPPRDGVKGARDLRADVGPPVASLSVRVLEPTGSRARATVFVLHGIRDRKESM
ncbi:hypothetical protein, partial [Escherichia coli]|uniref:hypothetical protein n=1 Tax=Escherichia coli TaxID=562 RepID=UPI00159BC602